MGICRPNVCQGANPSPLAPVLFEAREALLGQETRASYTRFFHRNRRFVLLALPGLQVGRNHLTVTLRQCLEQKRRYLTANRPTAPPQHLGDQQAIELAAAFQPSPAIAATECSCQLLIVATVAIRLHYYQRPVKTASKANRSQNVFDARIFVDPFGPIMTQKSWKKLFRRRRAASPAPSATPSTSMLRLCLA